MSNYSLNELLTPIQGFPEQASEQHQEKLTTLEGFHNDKVKKFCDLKESLPQLKNQLSELRYELAGWVLEKRFNDEHKAALELEEDIVKRITDIESDKDLMNYYLNVGDILFGYYDTQQRIAVGDNSINRESNKVRTPINSVLSYFKTPGTSDTVEVKPTVKKAVVRKVSKASEVVTDTEGMRRDKALEKYLSIVEPTAIKTGIMPGSGIESDYGCCPMFILIDSEKPSYKEPPREISYFAYKKINHLNEWLAQFQAKETTEIPQDIFEQIQTELKKERITDTIKLKPSKLREILKKLKLSKYYEHVAHIMNRLNGVQAPVLSREVEDKLRYMFREIQPSFIKHCPKGRSNFLSYSYVLYKFCQLLELDEFLPCFPLLKSREKLYMQDKIWQCICDDMGWEFIKSI